MGEPGVACSWIDPRMLDRFTIRPASLVRRSGSIACVIDEDVETPVVTLDLGSGFLDAGGIIDVDDDAMSIDPFLPQFLRGPSRLGVVPRSHQNGDSFLPELTGGFQSDAFVRARHQGSLFAAHNGFNIVVELRS